MITSNVSGDFKILWIGKIILIIPMVRIKSDSNKQNESCEEITVLLELCKKY